MEIARGLKQGDGGVVRLVDQLRDGLSNETLSIPLLATHYLELWHRASTESREHVGAIMRELSRFSTVAPVQDVQSKEVEACIDRRLGGQQTVSLSGLLGYGADHAFSSPHGRLRFIDSLATDDGAGEGREVRPPVEYWHLKASIDREEWEWFQLVGANEFTLMEGLDRTPEHRLGSRFQSQEEALRELLTQDDARRRRLADIIIVQEFNSALDEINRVCVSRNVDPVDLFLPGSSPADRASAIRTFVRDVPTLNVLATLRTWKHRDLTHPWEQHDKVDLMGLAVAVPYFDLVVTEARWAHLLKASGLAKTYDTRVCAGITAIGSHIEDVARP